MAAETPEQPPSSPPGGEGGGGGGGEQTAPAAAPPGGLSSYLPLIIAIVVMPVAAFVTLEVKSRMGSKAAAASSDSEQKEADTSAEKKADAGGKAAEKTESKTVSLERNTKLAVPITRELVAYRPADPAKADDFDKIVTLDIKGEVKDLAQADKIVVNIANTKGQRFAVMRVSVLGDHPELVERINQNRERLIDVASGTLSSKTLDDIEKAGFRNVLRSQLVVLFNQVLGGTLVQDVIITDFVTQ